MTFLTESLEPFGLPCVPQSAPSDAHQRRLNSYLLNRHRGAAAVRDIILADIRGFADLGLPDVAADLAIVLRLLLVKCPEARAEMRRLPAWDDSAAARLGL
ncbi:hypothetical protein [Methylosinus sp. Sm6]|uniref:hypothetical protein n=1 Tax=Methylosinus sp. Sm6 TaxID=2866948 RepID=UPI001C9A07CD|nr:hypothetical protein [Methylosinus sp. Sm6]MBY6240151.1 hypothetical protein [Methylosinus sp. Sm6]